MWKEISALYNFLTTICKFRLKRLFDWSEKRELKESKQERFQWALEHKDKLDFEKKKKNCVFIDEAGFNISMTRDYKWSKKPTKHLRKSSIDTWRRSHP